MQSNVAAKQCKGAAQCRAAGGQSQVPTGTHPPGCWRKPCSALTSFGMLSGTACACVAQAPFHQTCTCALPSFRPFHGDHLLASALFSLFLPLIIEWARAVHRPSNGQQTMESMEVLRPGTPPLPPTSAFAASAQQPWEAGHSPPSRSGAASPSLVAAGSLGLEGSRLSKSLSISRQGSAAVNPFGQPKPTPALWRASTAVTERAASQGLSFEALCGDSYIPPEDLRKPKALGEGAFAGEAACLAAASVPPPQMPAAPKMPQTGPRLEAGSGGTRWGHLASLPPPSRASCLTRAVPATRHCLTQSWTQRSWCAHPAAAAAAAGPLAARRARIRRRWRSSA